MNIKKTLPLFFILLFCFSIFSIRAQEKTKANLENPAQKKWSERMALSIIKRSPELWQIDNAEKPKWEYKPAFVALALEKLYQQNHEKIFRNYVKNYVNILINQNGEITNYNKNDYNLDLVSPGKLLFDLYDETNDKRYLVALETLRSQLKEQPRTISGGFWHKKIYPNQIWLDGIFMEAPFYAKYTRKFENGKGFEDIANQFELVENHFFDTESKLPFHAWDESKTIKWANPKTGTSPTIWSRAVGWYMMAMVDVLDDLPKNNPNQKKIIKNLQNLAKAIQKYQTKSGVWLQVPNKMEKEGNYKEASGSAMFVYVLAKGANKGYLPKKYLKIAEKGYQGILKELISVDENGEVHLKNISQSAGLGGNPFRDGSFEFYVSGKKSTDNSVGVAAFILASMELNQ